MMKHMQQQLLEQIDDALDAQHAAERRVLDAVSAAVEGGVPQAAIIARLGVSRVTLWRRLREHKEAPAPRQRPGAMTHRTRRSREHDEP